jgi:hypothetical protein
MCQQETTDLIFANYPIHNLTEEEKDDPYLVVQDFFSHIHLPEVREMLWASLKSTVTGNYPECLTRQEREDIVLLFELIERLVEAAHLINEKRKADNLPI